MLESWRLVDMGYEHNEFVGNQQNPPIEDADKSQCQQHAHSFVRDLPAHQFWDESKFTWPAKLKSRFEEIKEEFMEATANMEDLAKKGNNIWAGALTDEASSYGTGWRTLVLKNRGIWDPVNVKLFPKTSKAVHDSGVPAVEVFFASMKPNTDIKPHTDFTNFVLTSHLGLEIPENGNNKCRLTIGDETRQWINGEIMLFDTSILHEAINETDETRYILMMRIWHPDLTEVERKALQFVYDCLQVPELVNGDEETQRQVEKDLEALRVFPSTFKKGFGGGKKAGGKKKKKPKKK